MDWVMDSNWNRCWRATFRLTGATFATAMARPTTQLDRDDRQQRCYRRQPYKDELINWPRHSTIQLSVCQWMILCKFTNSQVWRAKWIKQSCLFFKFIFGRWEVVTVLLFGHLKFAVWNEQKDAFNSTAEAVWLARVQAEFFHSNHPCDGKCNSLTNQGQLSLEIFSKFPPKKEIQTKRSRATRTFQSARCIKTCVKTFTKKTFQMLRKTVQDLNIFITQQTKCNRNEQKTKIKLMHLKKDMRWIGGLWT